MGIALGDVPCWRGDRAAVRFSKGLMIFQGNT